MKEKDDTVEVVFKRINEDKKIRSLNTISYNSTIAKHSIKKIAEEQEKKNELYEEELKEIKKNNKKTAWFSRVSVLISLFSLLVSLLAIFLK